MDEKDKLVELVLKKVLEELLKKTNRLEDEKSQILYYFGNDTILKDELQNKVKIIDTLDINSTFEDLKMFGDNKNSKLLISTLCINNLIKLSQGFKNIIVESLLNGLDVYIVEEGLEYKKYLEPKALIKVYDEYLEKIKTFGVKVIKRSEAIEIFQEKGEIYISGIVTETKLKSLNLKNKIIILKENSKVTSLAQDYINQNNIEVHYERGQ